MKQLYAKFLVIACLLLGLPSMLQAQDTLNVMFYNLLNFPNGGVSTRDDSLRRIVQYYQPDVLMVCELQTSAGADDILNNALNVFGTTKYQRANFVSNQSSSDFNQNMIFFNSEKLTFVSQSEISTTLRDINEYIFYYNAPYLNLHNEYIYIDFYIAHLKASDGASDVAQRETEAETLMNFLDAKGSDRNRMLAGDLNFYDNDEDGYKELTVNTGGTYQFIDVVPTMISGNGNWHTSSTYAVIHTQSTRTTNLGDGGATGGMDDRFDFILYSQLIDAATDSVSYVPDSYQTLGNDGNHYNQSIINNGNTSVPDTVLYPLYHMSDHLPVTMKLAIEVALATNNNGNNNGGNGGNIAATGNEVALVSYNADDPDEFAFVALADIAEHTEIKFTDNGWQSSGSFRNNEGTLTWTAPAGGISCGTVVTITNNGSFSASHGSIASSGSFALSTSGDQILVYTGDDNSPTFITALNNDGSAAWQSDATSANNSALPTGLVNGTNAIALSEVDNAAYSGSTSLADNATAQTTLHNNTNWGNTSNNSQQAAPSGFTITDCTQLPVEWHSWTARANSNNGTVALHWTTASETNNDYFIIERSPNGKDFISIGMQEGSGTTQVQQSYAFTDASPHNGTNYYRLQQVDYEGNRQYSAIISTQIINKENVIIYPNPVKEQLHIVLPNAFTDSRIEIIDWSGRILKSIIANGTTNVNVANLAAGQYAVRITTNQQVIVRHIIK